MKTFSTCIPFLVISLNVNKVHLKKTFSTGLLDAPSLVNIGGQLFCLQHLTQNKGENISMELVKGWSAIAKLKSLSLFISLSEHCQMLS